MNKYKNDILDHHLNAIEFAESLYSLSEKQWRTQIKEDKWTIAEIMGHFKPWDEFVIKKTVYLIYSRMLSSQKDQMPPKKTQNHLQSVEKRVNKIL
ncbi:hypothetical protein [Alkalibacillus haloalkaliphilus]|uniref:hypothetical protein n=1 Tax=Alkalibacillus haloalkaliphilus TaxID=94136 RepID=UPI000497788F|nr:hypothetical protein [Alkalibacillus haloalkaliphilus]